MCMPALGGRIKVEIVEIRNTLEHICLLFQHQPNKSRKFKSATKTSNLQQKPTMASKHDMLRYMLMQFLFTFAWGGEDAIHLTNVTGISLDMAQTSA